MTVCAKTMRMLAALERGDCFAEVRRLARRRWQGLVLSPVASAPAEPVPDRERQGPR